MLSGPLFPSLNSYDLEPRIDLIIESHKSQIFEAQNLEGNLSILAALQLLMNRVFEREIIHQYTESQLVVQYCNCLIKIQSELLLPKGTIKIRLDRLGVFNDHFLSILSNYDLKKIQKIIEWNQFIASFSQYQIHSRCIRKLVQKYDLEHGVSKNTAHDSNHVIAERVRNQIRKIIQTIPEEEQIRLLNVGKGQKGLKNMVWLKIKDDKELKYFLNKNKTFLNRWVEVLPEIKFKLGM